MADLSLCDDAGAFFCVEVEGVAILEPASSGADMDEYLLSLELELVRDGLLPAAAQLRLVGAVAGGLSRPDL